MDADGHFVRHQQSHRVCGRGVAETFQAYVSRASSRCSRSCILIGSQQLCALFIGLEVLFTHPSHSLLLRSAAQHVRSRFSSLPGTTSSHAHRYGFHKINKTPRGQKGSIEAQSWEFSHPQFLHDRADLLDTIKRKTGTESAGSEGRSIPGTPASPARAGQISPRQQQTILHAQQVAKQEAMQRHSAAQYQQRLTAAGAAGLGSPQLVSPRPQAAATRASVAQQLDRQSPDDAMREVGYWKETCRSLQGALDESRRKEADLTTLVGQLYRALQAAGAQRAFSFPPL